MAQNVTVAGAQYSDVPAVDLPKTGGGTARFTDTSSDTVTSNKLLSGYTAHDSSGDSITGSIPTWTGTQASGVKSITANGTHDVTGFASANVNVPFNATHIVFTNANASASELNVPIDTDAISGACILSRAEEKTEAKTYGLVSLGSVFTISTSSAGIVSIANSGNISALNNNILFKSGYPYRYWEVGVYDVLVW